MNRTMNRHYKLLPSSFPVEIQRIQRSWLLRWSLITAGVFLLTDLLLSMRSGTGHKPSLYIFLFLGLLLVYEAVSTRRQTRRRLEKYWDTYDLEIGPDYFLRRQADLADLCLHFGEVTRIERQPGHYLHLIGNHKQRVIEIYEGIENFDEVFQIVSSIRPIEVLHRFAWLKLVLPRTAAAVGFVVMLWSGSPLVVVPLASVLIIAFLREVVRLRRDPNQPPKIRRRAWGYLFPSLVCFLKVWEVTVLLRR